MNTERSAIIYSALTQLTPLHRLVQPTARVAMGEDKTLLPVLLDDPHYIPIYIRMEVVDMDVQEALESAKPMDGETVLNTTLLQ